MPARELQIKNRSCYFRKSISKPEFGTERVLARDAFDYALLWLKRNKKEAVPYWEQARTYYNASKQLPPDASPLTLYYCYLNAIKALLVVKGQQFADRHGVGGRFEASKRALANEIISFQSSGIVAALSSYLDEDTHDNSSNLKDILSNLPFIHRAFRHTFTSHPEMFIPIRNVVYRKHPSDDYVWLTADIEGRFADGRTLTTLPPGLESDSGYKDRCVIRTKRRVKWYPYKCERSEKDSALARLQNFHRNGERRLYIYRHILIFGT